MADAPLFGTRRDVLFAALALPGLAQAASAAPKIVTVLGDSITAGFGLPAAAALPAQLQAQIRALGASASVRGAGVSGDTSAGGLARVNFSVRADTRLCVVALGGNDLLQGVPPSRTKANLEGIIERLKARKIRVLLAGLSSPIELDDSYVREFQNIFPSLAKAHAVPLYPNLLAGVALDARLNQADGVHPNAEGVKVIARRMAPVVVKTLG